MGFRAGPFVLCKDGCCHQGRRNTNFGPENFFSRKNFPPHMCSQNDQRDMGIILSHVCWGRTPPPPPARQVGQPQPKPPSRHGDQGGGGGGLGKWASVPSPPHKAIFFPPSRRWLPDPLEVGRKYFYCRGSSRRTRKRNPRVNVPFFIHFPFFPFFRGPKKTWRLRAGRLPSPAVQPCPNFFPTDGGGVAGAAVAPPVHRGGTREGRGPPRKGPSRRRVDRRSGHSPDVLRGVPRGCRRGQAADAPRQRQLDRVAAGGRPRAAAGRAALRGGADGRGDAGA